MRSIILSDNNVRVKNVFSPEICVTLETEAGLEKAVYTGADVHGDTTFTDVDYIFSTWGMPTVSAEDIARQFPRLRAVFYAAGSVQYFARPFLTAGIPVFSAWAANAVPVAEYTVAQIVLANKGFFRAASLYSAGKYKESKQAAICPGNFGATVGLIGLGMIGTMVAERLRAYRLRIIAFDPFASREKADSLGVTLCPLPELFATSDVISNHLANNAQTVGMLNADLFHRMKQSAVFLNTGRGAQVVESALADAMRECPTRTAVLDVTCPEPTDSDSPFITLPNVFLTPHIAGSAGDEVHRMSEYMLDEFRAFNAGRATRYGVTLKMLDTMA